MKTMKIPFFIFLTFSLSGIVTAQDCGLYTMSKGMMFGYQNLDAKGKVTGTMKTSCVDVNKVGAAIIYKVKSEYADSKNSNQSTHEYEMRCEDGKFYIDMQNFVDPKSMENFKDMEVTVNSKDMIYPAGLSAGQSLPDASITISAASGGISLLNLLVNITNRQVIGTESVTVPAGIYQCYKITYDVETKMMIKINTTVTEYINMGVGNVKSETFDKKGKLLGTTVLTELKK
jgi:hypothetical protein